MKKLYIEGTNILAKISKRAYGYCVYALYPDGTNYVFSCHFTFKGALDEMDRMVFDYSRHPQDFNDCYNPGCLHIGVLESR